MLDLGCGAGGLLCRLGEQTQGRLVGVDVSASQCVAARARGAVLGERLTVVQQDAAGLDEATLGTFDLIYVIGVAYILPPVARAAMLDLVGRCLRPGGVAVISAYTGPVGAMRAQLALAIRAGVDSALPVADQIVAARARLATLRGMIGEGDHANLIRAMMQDLTGGTDNLLYHEVLDPRFEVLSTADLASVLAPSGLRFLNYVNSVPIPPRATPHEAVAAAEACNLAQGGGYRFAVFGRPRIGCPGGGLRDATLLWQGRLKRVDGDGASYAPISYGLTADAAALTTSDPILSRMLDALAERDLTWLLLCGQVRRAMLADGLPVDLSLADTVENRLHEMWHIGAVVPVWRCAR